MVFKTKIEQLKRVASLENISGSISCEEGTEMTSPFLLYVTIFWLKTAVRYENLSIYIYILLFISYYLYFYWLGISTVAKDRSRLFYPIAAEGKMDEWFWLFFFVNVKIDLKQFEKKFNMKDIKTVYSCFP